jgi:stearoyl-CoA desaturase (delta-9 desaturase)
LRASASTRPTSWTTAGCAVLGLGLPALAGYLITGRITGALTGLLWGGLVRVFFIHHVTWSINSVCHFFGRRRFDIEDHSTNVFWLALPTLGEAWHHNHHAFPRSAVHGLGRRELDPSAWVIRALERVGLVWNVVRIAPERQAQKLIVSSKPAAAAPAAPARDRVATPTG